MKSLLILLATLFSSSVIAAAEPAKVEKKNNVTKVEKKNDVKDNKSSKAPKETKK